MLIREDDLSGAEIQQLLAEHLDHARASSPPESVHALDVDRLRAGNISFFSAWDDDELLGCGALLELDANHGEVKSMHTAAAHRRRGVAAFVLESLLAEAERRGYRRVSLETGSMEAFAPARALYRRFGFAACEPFANYTDDPNSVCMTLELHR